MRLCQVQKGLISIKVPQKPKMNVSLLMPDGEDIRLTPLGYEVVNLTITPGGALWAAVHDDVLYWWLQSDRRLTPADYDRWAALTGVYPEWAP